MDIVFLEVVLKALLACTLFLQEFEYTTVLKLCASQATVSAHGYFRRRTRSRYR